MESSNVDATPGKKAKRTGWRAAVIAAKREALAALPLADQEAAKAARQAARERASERGRQAAERTRTICSMSFAGAKAYEIAEAVGLTIDGLDKACRRLGIPFSTRASGRRRSMRMTDETIEALERVAADRGATVEQTVKDALEILTEDDAHVARRVLGVRRRKDG